MLQQILRDMYIDPELLAELSEHQKELLFVKMREEQVRRWNVREEAEAKNPAKKVLKPGLKTVRWLQGRDGCEWVWVMGEHKDDETIDQILERESKEKARLLAQKEAEEKRKKEEEVMRRKEKEELEKQRKLREEEERLKREQEELERERKRAEAEAYASLKELRLQKEKLEREEAEKKRKEQELKEKQEKLQRERAQKEKERKEREERLRLEEERRREELYMSLKKIRDEQRKAALQENDKADKIFQAQLRQSKKADKDRSNRAKIARDEVRRSKMLSKDLSDVVIAGLGDKKITPPLEIEKPNLPQRKRQAPRPPKPAGHKSVVEWFQTEEVHRDAGLLAGSKEIAPWFHGIITRQQAEYLLYPKDAGHFLIRVSERIWGYVLSFRDKDRAKHFLIDASDNGYHFFGQDQRHHASLEDLVNFHVTTPISEAGREVLKFPCGQEGKLPDYQELFSNLLNQNTSL